MRRGAHGGWNKRHGVVEETPRIDSFDPAISEGGGALFVCMEGKSLLLDCDYYTDYGPRPEEDREIVELLDGEWSQALELSRKENGFGCSQPFFLCPVCGDRRRFLYLTRAGFLCRKCSRLNYRSQQATRSDSMYYYDKGMALAKKHMEPPPFPVDGFGFCRWMPSRPRYMHQTTYRRYLQRFAKYQEQHQRRQLEDMAQILRIFK